MKKITLFVGLISILGIANAQKKFSIGLETSVKFDRYDYISEHGKNVSQYQLNGTRGLNFNYHIKNYSLETGFYQFNNYAPDVNYDYETDTPQKSYSSTGISSQLVIPLRFGREYINKKNTMYLKPEIGVIGIINPHFQKDVITMSFGSNYSTLENGDTIYSHFNTSSGYNFSKFNLGIETSLTAGFRIKNRLDIYLKGTIQNTIKPVNYEILTHSESIDSPIIKGTNTFGGHSILLNIGLKYNFDLSKKIEH